MVTISQTSQLSLFGSVTHYFAWNLTTGILSWKYYLYGVSLPLYVQLVIQILYCANGNLTTWCVNLTTKNISFTIYVDFRLRGLISWYTGILLQLRQRGGLYKSDYIVSQWYRFLLKTQNILNFSSLSSKLNRCVQRN